MKQDVQDEIMALEAIYDDTFIKHSESEYCLNLTEFTLAYSLPPGYPSEIPSFTLSIPSPADVELDEHQESERHEKVLAHISETADNNLGYFFLLTFENGNDLYCCFISH